VAALGVFVWSHIRVYLPAEVVTGAGAAAAFVLKHPDALPVDAAPGSGNGRAVGARQWRCDGAATTTTPRSAVIAVKRRCRIPGAS
jgi:hypothetical protein